MTSGPVRRGLHGAHAATALALVLTGFLILYPDFRTRTVGGFGREIGAVHVYVGIVFGVAPLLAWLLAPRDLIRDAWQRATAVHAGAVWRRTHLFVSVSAGALLVLTGLIMWLGVDLSIAIWDAADLVHVYSHWVVTLGLPLHLVAARRKIAERLRLALGGEPPELFEFVDDPEDEA
ncbi:MAG: cytochrome b/b6 domain-containing protein [Deltaproteobacteria bacterium]|nr:cytochrome b/b6 domain-containing protein [Deltaproteobacteria bacterium]MBW2385085.1 cytochrome b/b6 domain-containing protein [Deltaproteobacteria bacterium]